MIRDEQHHRADQAFDRIEAMILPTIAGMLEALLDASAAGAAGVEAEPYAAALDAMAMELNALTLAIEHPLPAWLQANDLRSAAA